MPIAYEIDHRNRLVTATPHGRMSDADIFGYQHEVWGRTEVRGYDELFDLAEVREIEFVSSQRVTELAELAEQMDAPGIRTRLAIVATSDLHFGLARMYQSQREMGADGTREVRVFRDRKSAEEWLSVNAAAPEAFAA
jgi:hypothetical protein